MSSSNLVFRALATMSTGNPVCRALAIMSSGNPVCRALATMSSGNPVCRALASTNSVNPVSRATMSSVNPVSRATMSSINPVGVVKAKGIQNDVSPLTTKRLVRKKKAKEAKDQEVFEVVAFSVSEEIDLETLQEGIEKQGLYDKAPLPKDASNALHVEARYRVDNEHRRIFIFREGAVVFWNVPLVERLSVLDFLKPFQEESYDSLLVHEEFESLDYTFVECGASHIDGDEVQLVSSSPSLHLEQFAFSNALATSVKLGIWEASLAKYGESFEWVLEDLKEGKKVRISRDEVLKKTGEILALRHLINLSSDLLDTPDFYWDRQDLEKLYQQTCSQLAINRRVKVMNDKLTYCCDLMDLLREHLNDKHHTNLEWLIILLIAIEVGFEILHMIGVG